MCEVCNAEEWARSLTKCLNTEGLVTYGRDFLTSVRNFARDKGHITPKQCAGVRRTCRGFADMLPTPSGLEQAWSDHETSGYAAKTKPEPHPAEVRQARGKMNLRITSSGRTGKLDFDPDEDGNIDIGPLSPGD